MDTDNTMFKVPTLGRPKAYNFEATNETIDIYQELSQISEEIEKCRQENCR